MTDHKQILRTYNAWRRDETGDRTLEDFGITPKMVGEAIDAVLKDADRYNWLCNGHGYFMEENMLCHVSNDKAEADAAIDERMDEERHDR